MTASRASSCSSGRSRVASTRDWLLALAFACSAAAHANDDFGSDWAGVLEDFVDKRIPELTRNYAEQDLRKRWLDGFHAPFTSVSVLQEDIVRHLAVTGARAAASAPLTTERALGHLQALQLDLAVVRYDLSRLNQADEELANLLSSCTNESVVGSRAISSVGGISIANVTLPDGPFYILLWDPTWISTIFSVVYDVWAWWDDDSKRKRARKALDRIPERTISSAQAVEISRDVCTSLLAERRPSIEVYRKHVASYRGTLEKQEAIYWDAYRDLERYFSAAAFNDVLARAGIWKTEVTRSQDVGSARLLLDLEIALNELRQLEVAAGSASSCRAGISVVEEYEDALIELQGQLKVFATVPQLPPVAARMTQVGTLLADKATAVPQYFAAAKVRPC